MQISWYNISMNRDKSEISQNRGFLRIIVILIIILVIISLLGLDAGNIWSNIFEPVFSFIGDLIVSIANFVVNLLRYAWAIFEN
jgi:hypothetical protein